MTNVKESIVLLKKQVDELETRLEKAMQKRHEIANAPIPKAEVLNNLFFAIDQSAKNFEKKLRGVVFGAARNRKAVGIYKCPEIIRDNVKYSELNVDSINYFFGDELKSHLEKFIAGLDWIGGTDGLTQAEYEDRLAAADAEVDRIKIERDNLLVELQGIFQI